MSHHYYNLNIISTYKFYVPNEATKMLQMYNMKRVIEPSLRTIMGNIYKVGKVWHSIMKFNYT
jgi:hypothetical protein